MVEFKCPVLSIDGYTRFGYTLSCMTKSRLPYSARKFLRKEKARIRREFFVAGRAEEKIQELMGRVHKKYLRKGADVKSL